MISHKFKCIFVHVPKTAGQSIEGFFKERHGITSKYSEELLMTKNSDPAKGPERLAHMLASEYVDCGHVSAETFQSYFTFGFVRNPWARLVSEYLHKKIDRKMPLKDYVLHGLPEANLFSDAHRHIIPQYQFLYDKNGNQAVDFIGRFENLQGDFDEVCEKLGLSDSALPHINSTSSVRRKAERTLHHLFTGKKDNVKKHYSEYYDSELKEIVAEIYRKDVESFGYEFEG